MNTRLGNIISYLAQWAQLLKAHCIEIVPVGQHLNWQTFDVRATENDNTVTTLVEYQLFRWVKE